MRILRLSGVTALVAAGCTQPASPAPAHRTAAAPTVTADAARAPVGGRLREVVFHGACDASGAVPLSDRRVVVADDEDNILRVYDADTGGDPLTQTDLSDRLGLPLKGKKKLRHPEMDLEAATRIGARAYWLTSHGRNKKGKLKPERLHLFATSTLQDATEIEVVGHPYDALVDDLVAAPQLAGFDLAAAAERAPKDDGGLNIE